MVDLFVATSFVVVILVVPSFTAIVVVDLQFVFVVTFVVIGQPFIVVFVASWPFVEDQS